MSFEAIILAGGFGTRLRSMVSDLPKPMAPIGGRPFLELLLNYLERQGFGRVILGVGHLHEAIVDHFGDRHGNLQLVYSIESTPLGTGGAIVQALKAAKEQEVFVLNGDTFLQLDYRGMFDAHREAAATISMAVRQVDDVQRYGEVSVTDGRVTAFCEKGRSGPGLVNSGVYLVSRALLEPYLLPETFSFENDFIVPKALDLNIGAFACRDYFIDIGIPEDYLKAQRELPELK